MSRLDKILIGLTLLIFIWIFVQTAWTSDEVYVTLRTIDNFVNGYGLRWNVAERVQNYPHPLWMMIMTVVYAILRSPYFTALVTSFVFSVATLVVLLARIPFRRLIPGLAILLVSKAYIDFSISGLENPATHLLLLLFFLEFFKEQEWTEAEIFRMGLFAGLGTLNRPDVALFFLPALAYVLYKRPSHRTVGRLALGFLPFLLWELFALFYYGFLFSNPVYAWLNTGISSLDLVRQSLRYFLDSLERDPITLIVIVVSLAGAFWRGVTRDRFFAAGIVLYLLYIIFSGGNFMSGRLFAAPLLAAVLLATRRFEQISRSLRYTLAMLAILLGFLAPYPTFLPHDDSQPLFREQDLVSGILDERGFYYHITGLPIVIENNWTLPNQDGWVAHGIFLRNRDDPIAIEGNTGFVGYYAGPGMHLLDIYALGDPLLARLPIPDQKNWRIGLFERDIPNGYVSTLRTGKDHLVDPDLAAYYDKLSLITRGPLWSEARLRTIWEMNTGQYDDLLKEYNARQNAP